VASKPASRQLIGAKFRSFLRVFIINLYIYLLTQTQYHDRVSQFDKVVPTAYNII
jgi:uncharacterized protein YqhQ